MAITAVGFDGAQVSEAQWSKIMRALGTGAAPSIVMSGFDASVGVGTRAVAVSAGEAMIAGTYITSTAVETRNAAANATGNPRQDWLVLKVDWATNLGTIEFVTGGTTLPSLTQTAGSSWRMPLAQVQVPAGASSIPAGNITIRKPTPRLDNFTVKTPPPVAQIFASSGGYTLDTVNLGDPGWNYRVKVSARIRVRNTSTPDAFGGCAELSVNCDGVQFGQATSNPFTSGLVETFGVPVQLTDVSPVQTGPCRIDLITAPNSLSTPGSYEVFGSYNKLVVEQTPV